MEKKLILIVDDDLDVREALSAALEDAGYSVLCAANGAAALEILCLAPREAGLVLLDLMMPVMDGWEFRRRQLEDPLLREIPVLILTAGGQVEKKAQNLAVAGWLRKPFELRELLRKVNVISARQDLAQGFPAAG